MEERILFSQKTTIFVPVDNDSRIKPMSKTHFVLNIQIAQDAPKRWKVLLFTEICSEGSIFRRISARKTACSLWSRANCWSTVTNIPERHYTRNSLSCKPSAQNTRYWHWRTYHTSFSGSTNCRCYAKTATVKSSTRQKARWPTPQWWWTRACSISSTT